jgi:hypothetical protein
MVQDVRDLFLSPEEIKTAFKCYQRMSPECFPNETILRCAVVNNTVVVSSETKGENPPKRREQVFQSSELLQPMIRFCIENNIMLPRDGIKSAIIREGKLALHVELNLATDAQASDRPMQMKHARSDYERRVVAE